MGASEFEPLERAVMRFMADAPEPTWIFLKEMPELQGDREALLRMLRRFETQGLVTRTSEPSGNPDDPDPLAAEDWWALTPSGESAAGLESRPSSRPNIGRYLRDWYLARRWWNWLLTGLALICLALAIATETTWPIFVGSGFVLAEAAIDYRVASRAAQGPEGGRAP